MTKAYYLTGIDPEKWRRFKAGCDLRGITIKQAFLQYIDITIEAITKHPGPYKHRAPKQKTRGRKT